jgi:uncharacterized RDD family membrane protein YckC
VPTDHDKPADQVTASRPRAALRSRLVATLLDFVSIALAVAPGLSLIVLAAFDAESRSVEPAPGLQLLAMALLGLLILGLLLYNAYNLSVHGQSLGKKIVGIKIVDVSNGDNPGFVRAVLVRCLANLLLIYFIQFYVFVDMCLALAPEGQCVHDLMANTAVVDCDNDPGSRP